MHVLRKYNFADVLVAAGVCLAVHWLLQPHQATELVRLKHNITSWMPQSHGAVDAYTLGACVQNSYLQLPNTEVVHS